MSRRTALIAAATMLIAVICSKGGFAQITAGTYQGVGTVGCLLSPFSGFNSDLEANNPSETRTASYNAYFYFGFPPVGIGSAYINAVGFLGPAGDAWYVNGSFTNESNVITVTNASGVHTMGPSLGERFRIDQITLYVFPAPSRGLDIVALNPTPENVFTPDGTIEPQICYWEAHLTRL